MAQLSDSQLVVLSTACQREDRSVYPLTAKLPGGAAAKVLNILLNKGLIKEVQAKREDTVWREDKKRGRLTLRLTRAAFDALGIDPKEFKATEDEKGQAGAAGTPAIPIDELAASDHPVAKANADSWNAIPAVKRAGKKAAAPKTDSHRGASAKPATRADSKQAQLIEMLKRAEGATIEEIAAKFEWQAHTVRGAIAGALKKKLGLNVQSEKVEGRRIYRIAA